MQECKLSLQAHANNADLVLTVKLDGVNVWHGTLGTESQNIDYRFVDDVDSPHLLEIVMQGKRPEHTTIAADGSIVQDCMIAIDSLHLDDIALGQVFFDLAQYHHDFNGSQAPVVDRFYGNMGCNGAVKFEFSSPLYLWLLEHM
jgi:hypothetical protein